MHGGPRVRYQTPTLYTPTKRSNICDSHPHLYSLSSNFLVTFAVTSQTERFAARGENSRVDGGFGTLSWISRGVISGCSLVSRSRLLFIIVICVCCMKANLLCGGLVRYSVVRWRRVFWARWLVASGTEVSWGWPVWGGATRPDWPVEIFLDKRMLGWRARMISEGLWARYMIDI